MRKGFVILGLMILPAMVFAQLSVGPAIYFKSPILIGQEVNSNELNVTQFSFGGDARYRIGWFQAEGLLLYSTGAVNSLDLFLDAGVALDVGPFILSLGAGPNFTNNFGKGRAMQAGLNTKTGVGLQLGEIIVGASYITALNISDRSFQVNRSSGLLGAHVLFQL